jgi:hypothetical protein
MCTSATWICFGLNIYPLFYNLLMYDEAWLRMIGHNQAYI